MSKRIKIIFVACIVAFLSFLAPVSTNSVFAEEEKTETEEAAESSGKEEAEKLEIKDEDIDEVAGMSQEERENLIEEACKNSGIKGLKYVVCPVLGTLVQIPDVIFSFVSQYIQINPQEVFVVDGTGKDISYKTWGSFRTIANIVMVIILLVVIFSQLTGVGIDNYGIKKILPRIIVVALLINLSYFLCKLAVDVSNIIGTGAYNMFKTFADQALSGRVASMGMGDMGAIVAVIFGVVKGARFVAGPLAIIVILFLLVGIICVGIIAISLGIRTMLVIVFTVISPVAFALYTLPNTQNLFKNWWKVFKACLIIYPICGALYGASFVIQVLTFTSANKNIGALLFAIVAPVIPFLFIPKLMKAATAGLGALATTIQSVTSVPKRAASAGVNLAKKSGTYQDLKAQGARKMQEIRNNTTINRLENKQNKRGAKGLNEFEKRRLASAYASKKKMENEDIAANKAVVGYQSQKDGRTMDAMRGDLVSAINGGDTDKSRAILGVLNDRYGAKETAKIIDGIVSDKDFNVANGNHREFLGTAREFIGENSGLQTMMTTRHKSVHAMIADNGAKGNLAEYTKGLDVSKEDIVASSGSEIKRLADAGKIPQTMADEILGDSLLRNRLDEGKENLLKTISLDPSSTNPGFKFNDSANTEDVFGDFAKQYDDALKKKERQMEADAAKAQYKMQDSANRARATQQQQLDSLITEVRKLNQSGAQQIRQVEVGADNNSGSVLQVRGDGGNSQPQIRIASEGELNETLRNRGTPPPNRGNPPISRR